MAAVGSITVDCPACGDPLSIPLLAAAAPSSPHTLALALEVDTSVVDDHKATAHPEKQGT